MGQHHRHRLAQPGNCVQLTLRNPQPPTTRKTLTGRNRRHPDRSGPLSYPATTITTHRPPAAPANPHPAPRAKSGLAHGVAGCSMGRVQLYRVQLYRT